MASSIIKSERGYDKKIAQIDTIIRLVGENSVIGLTSLSGISSKALQGIRSSMRSGEVEATIKVAKNTLKAIALEKTLRKSDRKDLKKIIPHINGSCAMIFTNTNPFRLQKFLNQNQVPAPAKTGQISTVDVFVPEGVTNLDPGPIISELGSIGLQTRIEKGKIRITKTAKVLSKGDVVTESHAAVLTRLGIQPFKVGLKLKTVLEGGELIDGSVLDIDEDEIIANLQKAHNNALSLAISPKLSYYTPLSIPILLKTAISQAMKLSFESNFITDKTVSLLLLKASNKVEMLKKRVLSRDMGIKF
ncbi:MAG: 50S ribosomal protein L10 [Candidatus Hodarchaeales archaeon]|jgi:ribosomal protein L10